MLGGKDGKSTFSSSNATTLVSRDTEIVGDIKFSGNVDIEGIVRGNIVAVEGKDAMVRVVDKGLVEGEIRAPSVIVNGAVTGDVYSTKHLELASKARVQGNVHYTLVEMAIGAEVNGSLTHTGDASKKSKDSSARAPSTEGQDTSADTAPQQVTPIKS